MTTQPAKWPPRIEVYKDPTSTATSFEFEEVAWPGPVKYLSLAEHEALIAEARAEGELIGGLKQRRQHCALVESDPNEHHAIRQMMRGEIIEIDAKLFMLARPQSSEPERKA
jgi:hypothetical protein